MKGLEFDDAFKEKISIGSGNTSTLSRFAIDYSSYNNVIIPQELNNFSGFVNSEKRRRISFVLSTSKVHTPILGIRVLYTTDERAKDFRKIFLDSNKNIEESKLKYFVFFDKDSGESTPGIISNIIGNIKEEAGNAFDKAIPYILVLGIAYIYFNRKTK